MTFRIRTATTLALAVGMTAWLDAADGVLLVQRITINGTTTTSQTQIEKHRMRAEMTDATGKRVVIFDGAKQVIDIIDVDKKTYTEMTKAEMDQMAAQLQGAMTQMQQMMASMPPEQRAQMEAQMGAMMRGRGGMTMPAAPAKPEYRKAGTDHVGKWTCDKYEILTGGQKTGEICTADPKVLGFTPADFEITRQMADFFKQLVPQSAQQMFSLGRPEEHGFAGIPIKQVTASVTTELTDASRQSFPDALFTVPAGYEKQSLMGRGRRGR